MSTPIRVPRLGFSMTEGRLAEWLIADGSSVIQGQPLYMLETEKSMQDIDSPASGTLRIFKEAGSSFDVGVVIGEIL